MRHESVIDEATGRKFYLDVPDDTGRPLRNVFSGVVDRSGGGLRSFWLVGHSQGGMTSRRLLNSPFFADLVDGWLSLSGGRIGGGARGGGGGGPSRTRAAG